MQVICEKYNVCKQSNTCEHQTQHEYNNMCKENCGFNIVKCTSAGLRKDKLKKLEEINDNRG